VNAAPGGAAFTVGSSKPRCALIRGGLPIRHRARCLTDDVFRNAVATNSSARVNAAEAGGERDQLTEQHGRGSYRRVSRNAV
jgi:hypothetical protein